MKTGAAAQRYAKAVFSIGLDSGEFERIGKEIQAFASVMELDGPLRGIFSNPLYDTGTRRETVSALSEKKGFLSATKNLLLLLVDKGRILFLPEISGCYQKLADEKAGRLKAAIVTASKVSDELVKELASSIEKGTGKKVSLSCEVDPALIGGIVLNVGDVVYDGSIRTQLNKLKDNIRKTA